MSQGAATRVMVITPHCDDESFGMGGTILKLLAAGAVVRIVAVVAGDVRFEHAGRVVTREARADEYDHVVAAYGSPCTGKLLRFHQDSRLDTVALAEIVAEIEAQQDEFEADTWYVPGPSFHQDHRRVYEACLAAMRPTRACNPREIYQYETPLYSWNPKEWRMNPHVYEDVEAFLDRKIQICEMYSSQVRVGVLSPAHIREFSVACGTEVGLRAAERFEVLRVVRK